MNAATWIGRKLDRRREDHRRHDRERPRRHGRARQGGAASSSSRSGTTAQLAMRASGPWAEQHVARRERRVGERRVRGGAVLAAPRQPTTTTGWLSAKRASRSERPTERRFVADHDLGEHRVLARALGLDEAPGARALEEVNPEGGGEVAQPLGVSRSRMTSPTASAVVGPRSAWRRRGRSPSPAAPAPAPATARRPSARASRASSVPTTTRASKRRGSPAPRPVSSGNRRGATSQR